MVMQLPATGMDHQEGGVNVVRQSAGCLTTGVGGTDRQQCRKRQTAVKHFVCNGSAVWEVALVNVLNMISLNIKERLE